MPAPAKNRSQTKDAAAVTSLRRQPGSRSSPGAASGVHPMTVSAWERDKLRLTSWQRSLVAALLLSQPRANLEQRLKDSESNPILVLAHLLSDGIRPSSVTVPSVPFLPSPHLRLHWVERDDFLPDPLRLLLCRCRPRNRFPCSPVPVESTRFSLLEIDDPSDD